MSDDDPAGEPDPADDSPPAHDHGPPRSPPLAGGEHPARELLNLLGRAHALAVLYTLARVDPRPWRFSELESELGISPNTLSTRLDELAAVGLIERTAYEEIPPRVEYEATPKARELDPVFRNLYEWADRHWPAADEAFETGGSRDEGRDGH